MVELAQELGALFVVPSKLGYMRWLNFTSVNSGRVNRWERQEVGFLPVTPP